MGEIAHSLMTLFTDAGLDKNAAISATIKTMVDNGVALPVAYDEVFGAGAYLAMKGTIHGMLRAGT